MIVITGMHRSGTSAVSMILEALGVDFGDHRAFYAADQWNEHGYFERRDVIDLNSRLLTGLPRTEGGAAAFFSQVRYALGPSRRAMERRVADLQEEIDALASRLGGIAVKDPRFCLTLPVWQEHASHAVVSLRHPGAVARSLKRRQRVPLALGLRTWNIHAEGLLAHTGRDTIYVDFDVLGSTEFRGELTRLTTALGLDVADAEAAARFEDRFASDLRHFRDHDDAELPAHTRDLWSRLQGRRRDQLVS